MSKKSNVDKSSDEKKSGQELAKIFKTKSNSNLIWKTPKCKWCKAKEESSTLKSEKRTPKSGGRKEERPCQCDFDTKPNEVNVKSYYSAVEETKWTFLRTDGDSTSKKKLASLTGDVLMHSAFTKRRSLMVLTPGETSDGMEVCLKVMASEKRICIVEPPNSLRCAYKDWKDTFQGKLKNGEDNLQGKLKSGGTKILESRPFTKAKPFMEETGFYKVTKWHELEEFEVLQFVSKSEGTKIALSVEEEKIKVRVDQREGGNLAICVKLDGDAILAGVLLDGCEM